ncbi:hypothetical protein [Rhizobium vallis]|uniref:hypothetical protein n=1 Tax=Rhizobium vallis TaxID=634290 RepID=UPI0013DF8567|nr:hypothetical protein [Rhizobium vallis]
MTSVRKWRGRNTAARRRYRFSLVVRRRQRLLRFGTAFCAAVHESGLPPHFLLAFFPTYSSSPALRRFQGRPLRPSGRKPGGLDGRNGLGFFPLLSWHPGKSIFLPLILFGEGVRLHYLYCIILALIDSDQG